MTDYPKDVPESRNHNKSDIHNELKDIREALIEAVEKAEERSNSNDDRIRLSERERMIFLEFFTVSHALIESQSIFLLKTKLIDHEYYDHEVTEWLTERFPTQKKREDFLHDCEVIGAGLKGEMKKVRQLRNDLVHNYDV